MKYKIAIVGELRPAEERVLRGILDEIGLPSAMCYFTSVTDGLLEIAPNLVVCLGDIATAAVCGKEYAKIKHWRGSIIQTAFGKAMPCIHPDSIIRKWIFRPAVVADFERAAKEMEYPEIRRRKHELVVSYDFNRVMAELERLKGVSHVAFDIETESGQITCIGFSDRPDWALCVPFWFGASGSLWDESQERAIWGAIREILVDERIIKIGHNGIYDMEFIHNTMSIDVRGYGFDTMLGFHCLYPELPKGLDYLVSIYTDHPYYKFGRQAKTMDEHFRYNATDCCLTFDCYEHVARELDEAGLNDFYRAYIHSLVAPILHMQLRGVAFDSELRNRLRKQCRGEVERLQLQLNEQAGRELNINSPKQMKEWLYGKSGLGLKVRTKKRKDTGEETVSADEEALEILFKETGNPAIQTVLEMREKQKILSTYLEVELDSDKRIRCSYLIHGTETGRLSSRQTARGTGTNLQNIPGGDIRRLFVADPGCVFINSDLSQAEARVVAYLAAEDRLIRVFDSGGDIHRKNAANIFACKEEEVTDEQRQLAKRIVHASNYGMGPRTFARQAGVTEKDAIRLLNQYFATYPRIKIWHRTVADELQRRRTLYTPFGRRRLFFGRWGDSTVKEGYAFIPQSTVAEIVNQAIIELDGQGEEILLQVHDSILIQVKDGDVERGVERIRKALTRPIVIGGRVLTIPCDFKVGVNWQDMVKYKSPQEAG